MFLTKLKIAAVALSVVAVVGGAIGAGVFMSPHDSAAAEQERIGKDDQKRGSQKEDRPPVQARPEIEPKTGAPKVQVMRPISRKVVERQEFTGRTEADTVEVLAQASGMLDKVHFEAGAAVKKGDLLFQIDPRPYQAELDKAEAESARAFARFKQAAAQLERAKKLKTGNAINEEDFDRVSADREDAEAAVKAADASRQLVKLHLASTQVTAPISGQIGRPLVTPGSVVKAATTMLTTIVALEPMHVQFDIDEGTFLRLQRKARGNKSQLLGSSVSVGLSDEKDFPHRGTIDFVGNQVRAGTLSVRAVVPNPDHLLVPGLFVRVRLAVSEPQQALLVPERALERLGGQAFVFVVTDQKKVERRAVKLGFSDDGMRVVKEGLAREDTVILGAEMVLREGMAVEPERVSAPRQPKD